MQEIFANYQFGDATKESQGSNVSRNPTPNL